MLGCSFFCWFGLELGRATGDIEGKIPVASKPQIYDTHYRVVLIGTAARNGRYISPKAKYRPETDSVQVVRTKDEKYFAKRVKENLTSLPGKRMTPFTASRPPGRVVVGPCSRLSGMQRSSATCSLDPPKR